jgi:chemotaxis protein methyltransferase CheR
MVAAVGERRLSPEIFRLLRDLIYDYCGIFFAEDNAYIVHRRLQPRLEVRALVSFGQINLMDDQMMRLVGDVDVILCRNVLIYFDTAARKKVISSLHGKLVKGGYLLLGHSESLINLSTSFDLVHLKNDMVYRKPWNG